MRLRRLCLDRFGHFTGRAFDFGAAGDGPDFHIIHGPNEAGKTTAMEGALRLFYGFPHRESYDFKHQRKNLRVSAVVEIEGTPRHFTRLPLRSGALVDETGTALPEAALAAHLGGLARRITATCCASTTTPSNAVARRSRRRAAISDGCCFPPPPGWRT